MYEFDLGSFFIGLLIVAAGVAFMRWHQWVADNFGDGVGDYERFKLWALIVCGVGLIVTVNLHTVILNQLFGWLLP